MERIRVDAILIAAACALAASGANAATFSWSQVQLTGASGIPAEAKHSYTFKGIVAGYGTKSTTDVSFSLDTTPVDITSTSVNAVFATIWVQGKGSWDGQTKEAKESFLLDGDVKGKFVSRLKCTSDPWLGSSSCVVLSAQQVVEKGPIYNWPGMVKSAKLPLSSKAVDPVLAAELSKKTGAGSPPPPAPKVADKTLKPGATASAMQAGTPGAFASAGPALGQPNPRAAVSQQAFPKMERAAPAAVVPNWGAIGGQASRASPPAPAASVASLTVARAGAPAAASANPERDLAVASCTRSSAGGLRFSCTTRAGFDRCESFRKQRRVEQCALAPVR